MEYWNESDSDIDEDFSVADLQNDEPKSPDLPMASHEDEKSIIWWVVVFTCLLETLHSLPSQAITWLLKFLSSLFVFLSEYSYNIANIAYAFPSTLHQRTNFILQKLSLPSVQRYVVCQACSSLHNFNDCLEKRVQ